MNPCARCNYRPSPMWRKTHCPECGFEAAPPADPDEAYDLPFPPLAERRPAEVGMFLEVDFTTDKPGAYLCHGNPESVDPPLRLEVIRSGSVARTKDGTPQSPEASEQQPQGSPAGSPKENAEQLHFIVA